MTRRSKCAVCGEPYYSPVDDMEPWELKLWEAGAGCPCCLGDDGDDKPSTRPEWREPPPTVVLTCQECGAQLLTTKGTHKLEEQWLDTPLGTLSHARAANGSWPSESEGDWLVTGDEAWCDGCYARCDGEGEDGEGCDAVMRDGVEGESPFFLDEDYTGRHPLCEDCYDRERAEQDREQVREAISDLLRGFDDELELCGELFDSDQADVEGIAQEWMQHRVCPEDYPTKEWVGKLLASEGWDPAKDEVSLFPGWERRLVVLPLPHWAGAVRSRALRARTGRDVDDDLHTTLREGGVRGEPIAPVLRRDGLYLVRGDRGLWRDTAWVERDGQAWLLAGYAGQVRYRLRIDAAPHLRECEEAALVELGKAGLLTRSQRELLQLMYERDQIRGVRRDVRPRSERAMRAALARRAKGHAT